MKFRLIVALLATLVVRAQTPADNIAQRQAALQRQIDEDARHDRRMQAEAEQQRAEQERQTVLLLEQRQASADADAARQRRSETENSSPLPISAAAPIAAPSPVATQAAVFPRPSPVAHPNMALYTRAIVIGILAGGVFVVLGKIVERRFFSN